MRAIAWESTPSDDKRNIREKQHLATQLEVCFSLYSLNDKCEKEITTKVEKKKWQQQWSKQNGYINEAKLTLKKGVDRG